jgi:hypothetical protein
MRFPFYVIDKKIDFRHTTGAYLYGESRFVTHLSTGTVLYAMRECAGQSVIARARAQSE